MKWIKMGLFSFKVCVICSGSCNIGDYCKCEISGGVEDEIFFIIDDSEMMEDFVRKDWDEGVNGGGLSFVDICY